VTPATHSDAILAALSVRGLLHLVDTVCSRRGVTRDELCGLGRTRTVATARHELWWLVRHHPERRYSYLEIARLFRREPSTVVCGVAAHDKRHAASPVDG
jgi:chromosomal replication initiation ATPase DnaA